MKRCFLFAFVLLLCTPLTQAQSFPVWEKLLRYSGGTSDATTVPVMMMGNHMQMSVKSAPKPGDAARAAEIAAQAKAVLVHYADVNTALADGYKPFAPTGKMGEEVHYSNYRLNLREATSIDYAHPGSILYKRAPQGMVAVGVMYTASAKATPDELNARAPLSISPWHRHVDICGAPDSIPVSDQLKPGATFGFSGSLHTQPACEQAGGLWIPLAFGWMTHVYPNETDPAKVWGGAHMDEDMEMDGMSSATGAPAEVGAQMPSGMKMSGTH